MDDRNIDLEDFFGKNDEDTDEVVNLEGSNEFDDEDVVTLDEQTELNQLENDSWDDFEYGKQSEFGENNEQTEEDVYQNTLEMLDDMIVEDDTVELGNFDIEDAIEIDVKTGIDKKIVISIIIFVIVSVLVSGAFVLFSKYTLVNDNIKDAAWTNGTFSIINKEYKCSVDDISTGDLVLYTDSNNVYFKTYNYATIIDTSLSNPRKIKVIINKTGEQSYLSIENIYYVVKPSGDYDYVKVE